MSSQYVPASFSGLTVFQLQCLSAHLKFHPTVPATPVPLRRSAATPLSNIPGPQLPSRTLSHSSNVSTSIPESLRTILLSSTALISSSVPSSSSERGSPSYRRRGVTQRTTRSPRISFGRRRLLLRSSSFSRIRAVAFVLTPKANSLPCQGARPTTSRLEPRSLCRRARQETLPLRRFLPPQVRRLKFQSLYLSLPPSHFLFPPAPCIPWSLAPDACWQINVAHTLRLAQSSSRLTRRIASFVELLCQVSKLFRECSVMYSCPLMADEVVDTS